MRSITCTNSVTGLCTFVLYAALTHIVPWVHYTGMGVFVLSLAMGIMSRRFLSKFPQLPYTVVVLLLGLAVGSPSPRFWGQEGGEEFAASLDAWRNIDPHVVLTAMLPILIFESAFNTDVHIFMHEIAQVGNHLSLHTLCRNEVAATHHPFFGTDFDASSSGGASVDYADGSHLHV